MRVHDYKCNGCNFIFEEWVEREQEVRCPNCDSPDLTIVFIQSARMLEKKQPYDYLHKRPPDDPISVSVPKAIKKRGT